MKHQYLSSSETSALLQYADRQKQTPRLAIYMLLTTGMRVSELCLARIRHLLPSSSTPMSLLIPANTAKITTERKIPLKPIVQSQMRLYIDSHDHLILGNNPCSCYLLTQSDLMPLSTRTVQAWIATAGDVALGRKISPHTLRHTFATHLMKQTDIRTVQYLMGHTELHSTMIYTHIMEDRVNEAIQNMVF